ncbi:Ig-like domain-containing protein [Scandinavium goeteborgense]|uniref:Ig-like protein group 3 n=1 Tax=Scandinavium goeteborgense TaxID=1851514 RepID=A0A4R6DPG6_SCAGO|nr:Ig-like domain-containing protein [Scandinavium goeteborgense]TDN46753.1 Ig-like protein group 3 [Scandinavium goeteborgense]
MIRDSLNDQTSLQRIITTSVAAIGSVADQNNQGLQDFFGAFSSDDANSTLVETTNAITSIIDHTGNMLKGSDITTDSRPQISGSAEANSNVHVHVYGPDHKQLYWENVVADANGHWTYQPQPLSVDGQYSFGISVIDSEGNIFRSSSTSSILYHNSALDIISLDSVTDNVDQGNYGFTGALLQGATTDDAMPVLSGKANSDSEVNIYDNGVLIGTVTSDEAGVWVFKPQHALSDGEHSIYAAVVTVAGESAPTGDFNFTVDTHIGESVVVGARDAQNNAIEEMGVTADNSPTLYGYAEPGAIVHVHVYRPDGAELYWESTLSDAQGNWTYQPHPFSDVGNYSFKISIIDAAGNIFRSDEAFRIGYDDASLHHFNIDSVVDNVSHSVHDFTGILDNFAMTNDTQPELSGTGNTLTQVNIYDHHELIGSVITDAQGNWTFKPDTPLADGDHELSLSQVTPGGESQPLPEFSFTVDSHVGDSSISSITDQNGNSLHTWERTSEDSPLLSGYTEAGSAVSIKTYGPQGRIVHEETIHADDQGQWHYQSPHFPVAGEYGFSFSVIDEVGNTYVSPNRFMLVYTGTDTTSEEHGTQNLTAHDLLSSTQPLIFNAENALTDLVDIHSVDSHSAFDTGSYDLGQHILTSELSLLQHDVHVM